MVLIITCYSDSVPGVNLQIRQATKKRAKLSCSYHKLHEAAWADPEGGGGGGITNLSSQHLILCTHQPASETALNGVSLAGR